MSVELKHPTVDGVTVKVHGSEVKQWTDAGWIKVGRSEEPPTDPELNAPNSPAPLDENTESDDS